MGAHDLRSGIGRQIDPECAATKAPLTVRDPGLPEAAGLYDPAHEHDACGVGFIANIKGKQVPPDRRGRAADPASTSTIAARSAPTRAPATAPAS